MNDESQRLKEWLVRAGSCVSLYEIYPIYRGKEVWTWHVRLNLNVGPTGFKPHRVQESHRPSTHMEVRLPAVEDYDFKFFKKHD